MLKNKNPNMEMLEINSTVKPRNTRKTRKERLKNKDSKPRNTLNTQNNCLFEKEVS